MADAAEETVKWTRAAVQWAERQFYATIGEIAALVVTILVAIAAVTAAFMSNSIARKSAERQLRAYVHLNKPNIALKKDGEIELNIRVQNAGQTPAHNAIWSVRKRIAAYDPEAEFGSDSPKPEKESGIVLSPKDTVNHPFSDDSPASVAERAAVTNSKAAIYVYGTIRYRDVFNKDHTTRFQLLYRGVWEGTQLLSTCHYGNEAD